MAIVGVNVLIVLFIGIFLAGIIGILTGSFSTISWMGAMGTAPVSGFVPIILQITTISASRRSMPGWKQRK